MSTATATPAQAPTMIPMKLTPLGRVHAALDDTLKALAEWPHEQAPILAKRVHDLKNRVNAAAVGVPIRDPKLEL